MDTCYLTVAHLLENMLALLNAAFDHTKHVGHVLYAENKCYKPTTCLQFVLEM